MWPAAMFRTVWLNQERANYSPGATCSPLSFLIQAAQLEINVLGFPVFWRFRPQWWWSRCPEEYNNSVLLNSGEKVIFHLFNLRVTSTERYFVLMPLYIFYWHWITSFLHIQWYIFSTKALHPSAAAPAPLSNYWTHCGPPVTRFAQPWTELPPRPVRSNRESLPWQFLMQKYHVKFITQPVPAHLFSRHWARLYFLCLLLRDLKGCRVAKGLSDLCQNSCRLCVKNKIKIS